MKQKYAEDVMKAVFKNMTTALKNKDAGLFQSQWHENGYSHNLAGSSGLSGAELFAEGSREDWYLKPRFEQAIEREGAIIVPCDIWSYEKNKVVDEVLVAIVQRNARWVVLGVGEDQAQVEALVG